jgi:hypothetical protein
MRRDEIIGGNPDESDSDLLEEDKTELDDDSANDYEESSFRILSGVNLSPFPLPWMAPGGEVEVGTAMGNGGTRNWTWVIFLSLRIPIKKINQSLKLNLRKSWSPGRNQVKK